MLSLVLVALLLARYGRVYALIGPVADLTISNVDIAPDGFNRGTVLAGGTFPGPLISGMKGDSFQLNVVNKLTDQDQVTATSIHWHGIFQRGSSWADGVDFVTQCPISTGHAFLYRFNPLEQSGTFWYHSHIATQYCDGLRGPLVIYDPQDPNAPLYDVDNESTVITLADWFHVKASQNPASPDATLINGKGRYPGGPAAELAVVNVMPGQRYRLRIVAMSCVSNFIFSIDGHSFTVIEADGVSTKPVVASSLQIFAGQRYSVVLQANQSINNYWIRAKPNVGPTNFTGGVNSAILRYSGAPLSPPNPPSPSPPTPTTLLQESSLSPLLAPGAPGGNGPADVSLNLLFTLGGADGARFLVNGASYVPPPLPVLLQILSGASRAQDLLPSGSVYVLPLNATVEVSMPAGIVGGPHPFHLHGHAFDVVRGAGSMTYNYANPVRRDVVSIGAKGDNVTIRFRTDNPGPWLLHCHIDRHLTAGLAIVFAEAPTTPPSQLNPVPQEWQDLCPIYNAQLATTSSRTQTSSTHTQTYPTSAQPSSSPANSSDAQRSPALDFYSILTIFFIVWQIGIWNGSIYSDFL